MVEILSAHDLDDVGTLLREAIGPCALRRATIVQSLWGGYGRILRCELSGANHEQVIVKLVRWPTARQHPRGWATDFGHHRKVRSYQVESHWYQHVAGRLGDQARVPQCIGAGDVDGGVYLVLEDLDAAGFTGRANSLSGAQVRACLSWLAHFHATFLGEASTGLWPVGTYWHLATRPEELAAMPDGALKDAAAELDHRLNGARFHTLVHGDAKDENFCFHPGRDEVAAVDFQYVGAGCGMKDVAYFFSSCLSEAALLREADAYLAHYFTVLEQALRLVRSELPFAPIEAEWRRLYPLAWADFARFLLGWSPGHRKLHGYTAQMTELALRSL